MTHPISVSDFASNAPEQIEHYAELLSKSAQKRHLFEEIYRGKRSIKTVKELAEKLRIPEKQILTIAKPLAVRHLFEAIKVNGRVAYRKIPTIGTVKDQILRLARNKTKLESFPTKRKPQINGHLVIKPVLKIRNVLSSPPPKFLSIEAIEQFAKVRSISNIPAMLYPPRLAEAEFKKGIGQLLGHLELSKDWGGEMNDVFSINLVIDGKRYPAALAFKGPATTGRLTPKKMGKNGDQISRLFGSASAQVFLVQYEGEIDQSVVDLMKNLAVAKSALSGQQIWWGVVDKRDTYRLRLAYPEAFDILS